MVGAKQDRRAIKGIIFARYSTAVIGLNLINANDNDLDVRLAA